MCKSHLYSATRSYLVQLNESQHKEKSTEPHFQTNLTQVSNSGQILSLVHRRCRQRCHRKPFIFSSSSPEPLEISTRLGTKHPWVKGIQFYSGEGPSPISKGDNSDIVKIHRRLLKFFSRTTGPKSTKLATKHP